ncbi:Glucooligosaccharide oxidase [Xylaria intraflava]|nr:Glucooligosaccharide oxidase [Xylaria intraflava]
MGTQYSELLEVEGLKVKTPLDSDWDAYSLTYNRRVPAEPAIVILPYTSEQVARAVRVAGGFEKPIQARSGGHSYASHSNGGVDGAVVIDLRYLQDIVLCDLGIVRVGGGVRLGKMALTIFQLGGLALAHGTCPGVGIGGHFTHGGFGFSSRAWGLAMDQIVALDVVTASGQIVRASDHENTELFTAMRGAADSFGIVVNFYLQTQPAPETILKWTVDVPAAMRSVESAVEAFLHVQNFANDASIVDRRLGFVVYLSHDRFSMEGTYLGDQNAFTSNILPALLRGFPEKELTSVQLCNVDWLSSLRMFAGGTDLDVGDDDAEHAMFFSKCAVVSRPGLSGDALKRYFEYIRDKGAIAPVGYFISMQLYGGADSQITANTKDDAFAHRDAMWTIQHYAYATDVYAAVFPEEGMRFVEGLNNALGAEHGAYNNYADPSLAPGEAQTLYYGEKLAKLKELKRKLDPGGVFSHPQSIEP